MTKCCICKKKFTGKNKALCRNCLEFFKWKYGENFQEKLERIRKLKQRDRKFSLIKLRRRKWKQKIFVF